MPGRMPRSAPQSPFELPEVTAVVCATHLSCQNAGKAQKFALVRRFIWGIPVNQSQVFPSLAVQLRHRIRGERPGCSDSTAPSLRSGSTRSRRCGRDRLVTFAHFIVASIFRIDGSWGTAPGLTPVHRSAPATARPS